MPVFEFAYYSLAGLVRLEYQATSAADMRLRTQTLFTIASRLKWLSNIFNICVVVVNQVRLHGLREKYPSPVAVRRLRLRGSTRPTPLRGTAARPARRRAVCRPWGWCGHIASTPAYSCAATPPPSGDRAGRTSTSTSTAAAQRRNVSAAGGESRWCGRGGGWCC
jgi:hypothetical protein